LESPLETIEKVLNELETARYVADRSLATVLFLANLLEKPVFLEGEPGVGKTELALVLARILDTDLIRLQCYEGLDVSSALYEWNYPRQLLHIKLMEQKERRAEEVEKELYSLKFLMRRPLLEAIVRSEDRPLVLLIDEIDRSDEEFEAFLLEVLSDFQVTVPEIGTIEAKKRPMVVVTSNRTRDVHDALKRRCLYHWIEFPSVEKEYRIILAKEPEIESRLAASIARFMQRLRKADFRKKPGVSETLDWARALMGLHVQCLDKGVVMDTLGCVFKNQEDIRKFKEEIWSKQEENDDFHEGWPRSADP
jgi:MoxR-like ATPase